MSVKQLLLLASVLLTTNQCLGQFFDNKPLYRIDVQTFKDYEKNFVKNVSFAYCQIHTIDRYTFTPLVRLASLRLDNNALSNIHENLFDNNVKLQYLNLAWNRFHSLPPYIFAKLTSLKELNLHKNNIKSLNLHIFENLRSLTTLTIYSNGLTQLDTNIFRNNINMEYLHFGDNLIEFLHEDIFNNMPRIHSIMMHKNKVKYLPNKLFSRLPNLKNVSLAYNGINDLYSGLFDNNQELQNIWLGANKVTTLKNGLFKNAEKLQYLDLIGNQINDIGSNVFPVNSKLQKLYLSNNSLSTIDIQIISNLKYLTVLTIDINPWTCDCNGREVYNKWKQLSPQNKIPYCSNPPQLRNKYWTALNYNDFPCAPAKPLIPPKTNIDFNGNNAILGCETDPTKDPWKFGDTSIAEHFKGLKKPYKICQSTSADGRTWYNLTIEDLKPSDSGTYKCNGVEQHLSVTPDLLKTLQKPTLSLFLNNELQLNADFGQNIIAGCQIYSRGQKPNLVWSFNNQPIGGSSAGGAKYEINSSQIVIDGFSWYNLTINSVNDGDTGIYACQADGYNEIQKFKLKINKRLNTNIPGWSNY